MMTSLYRDRHLTVWCGLAIRVTKSTVHLSMSWVVSRGQTREWMISWLIIGPSSSSSSHIAMRRWWNSGLTLRDHSGHTRDVCYFLFLIKLKTTWFEVWSSDRVVCWSLCIFLVETWVDFYLYSILIRIPLLSSCIDILFDLCVEIWTLKCLMCYFSGAKRHLDKWPDTLW